MKYKTLLVLVSVIIVIWLLRSIIAGNIRYYGFITGNILLATIPLLLEGPFRYVNKKFVGIFRKLSLVILATIWIMFMPNAFYILTDFMHLNSEVLVNIRNDQYHFGVSYLRGDGLYVLDTLLLLLATVYGALVGSSALLNGYKHLRNKLNKKLAITLTALVILLSAIGVYIGRFGRWNSWQGLIMPWQILYDLVSSLSNTAVRERFVVVIMTVLLFELISIGCVNYLHNNVKQE